jgi:peptidyl-prolyl cis-trans isomerase C
MATIYENPSIVSADGSAIAEQSPTYQKIDTRIPPKARPVLDSISVNGIPIAESDILAEVQNHPAENPGTAVVEAARALVVRALLLQEVKRLEVAEFPVEQADGQSQTRDDAAIRVLIEREVLVPTATEEECRRYFDQNPGRFQSEPIHEAKHILLGAPAGDKTARQRARAVAEDLIGRLLANPGEFAAMALAHSDCPSREQGGNLGQLTHGSTVPEFERALERMKAGTICSTPVESRFGFHIILLDRTVPGNAMPFEIVQDRIAAWLDASAWSKAISQYIAVLAGKAQIVGIDLDAADGPLIQ